MTSSKPSDSEEEEDYYLEVHAGVVVSLTSPSPYHMTYRGLLLLPRPLEADSLHQRPSSWLRC